MRKLFLFLLLALAPTVAHAQYAHYQNFCTAGGAKAVVQGLGSSNFLLSTFPGCTVTVYQAGTSTPVTLASTSSGTPLSNPFTATTSGYFTFYVLQSVGAVDVKMSGTGMTTTTLANVILENAGVGGVTAINGTPGSFTFTGSGVTCSTTTCTFTGGSGSFTVAQYNSLLQMPSSAGSTNQALFAAGNNIVFTGQAGATDSQCPPFSLGGVGISYRFWPDNQISSCYVGVRITPTEATNISVRETYNSAVTGANANGGGAYRAREMDVFDDGIGISTFGGWHYASAQTTSLDTTTPGIEQMFSGSFWSTSPGDKALNYWYFNYHSGPSVGADEGVKMNVWHMAGIGSFKGTMNANYAPGSGTVFTTQTQLCGGNASGGQNNCAGGGLVLLKLSSAQPITVATLVQPNATTGTLGTMTFAETLTPSAGSITIANAANNNGNPFSTGDTFVSPYTAVSGTMPTSGYGCWISTTGTWESALYSLSGGNITITTHRYQHSANAQFWAGDCLYFDPTPDSNLYGSKTTTVAVIDTPNSIRWTTYTFNQINGGTFINAMAFKAGVAGRNVANLYQGARVLDVADPNAPPGQSAHSTGIMHLEANNVNWVSGEAVEQSLYAAAIDTGNFLYCYPLIQGSTNCNALDMQGPVTAAYDIGVDNLLSTVAAGQAPIGSIFSVRTVSPGIRGSYDTFANLALEPNKGLISISTSAAATAGKSTAVIGWPGVEGSFAFRRDIGQWQFFSNSTRINGKTIFDGNTTPTNLTLQANMNFIAALGGDPPSTFQGDLWLAGGSINRLRFKESSGVIDTLAMLSDTYQYVGTITTSGAGSDSLAVAGLTTSGHCAWVQVGTGGTAVSNGMMNITTGSANFYHATSSSGLSIEVSCIVR